MKHPLALAAMIAASLAAPAWADDPTPEPAYSPTTLTRSEVQADLVRFKHTGVNPWSTSYNPLRHAASVKSRAEVKQEYLAARDEARALAAEDSGASWRGRMASPAPTLLAGRPATAQ
ncbi:MAG: DUF4148 domain-containing protein [Aquabacterium sp.]|nr:DUF4148 domain-containing protein [Aquabacterium sp.]